MKNQRRREEEHLKMLLKATRPAQYSRSPGPGRSDDDHGDAAGQADEESPTLFVVAGDEDHRQDEHEERPDEPVRTRDSASTRPLRNTCPAPVTHLCQGGYIIRMRPTAREVGGPHWNRR